MSVEPLVSLEDVSFSYPLPGGGSRPALRGITFALYPGEAVVVLGANGAGKSTLAALLAGALQPTAGQIRRDPRGAGGVTPVLAVGLVTENPEDTFSCPLVREEMGVALENLDREPAEIDRAVDAMLAEIGLAGHAGSPPRLLSGGQKQLLAVSSVLIADPPLLVLDEPLTLLDGRGRAEVNALLERRGSPEGRAVLYLTSELDEIYRGERVVVLHRGTVVWEGAREDLTVNEEALAAWGLVPPDLAVLGAALRREGFPVTAPFRDPERMAAEIEDFFTSPAGCSNGPLPVPDAVRLPSPARSLACNP